MKKEYIPQFDSVLPFQPRGFNQKTRLLSSMLCISDFVIVDSKLDQEPFAALVKDASDRADFAARRKVFDISKNTAEIIK